jgi:hypothetical protein
MRRASLGAAVLSLFFGLGADHRDAPAINYDATGDVNDVYTFVSPENANNVILVTTVNPFSAPGNAHTFGPDVLYMFKIDNDGDFFEDLVIQATFNEAVPGSTQQVSVRGPAAKTGKRSTEDKLFTDRQALAMTGNTGTILTFGTGADQIRIFAGLRDDPFFFDATAVGPFLGLNGNPTPARSPLGGGMEGRNFFGGVNVSALVIDIPASLLRGESTSDILRIWGTTARSKSTKRFSGIRDDIQNKTFVQVDRMGIAGYNTVFIPNGGRGEYDLKPGVSLPNPASRQDEFNKAAPANDLDDFFNSDVLPTVLVLNTLEVSPGMPDLTRFNTVLSSDTTDTILFRLQRDVIFLDVTNTTAGFEALNGRRLADDVIDVLLELGSGITGAGDGVDANDVAAGVVDSVSGAMTDATGFLTVFPYLAPPKGPAATIPPRGGN